MGANSDTSNAKGHGPAIVATGQVLPAWIDYNGHMNVAYYTQSFDQALDEFLEKYLGIGPDHVAATQMGPYALQAHYHYLGELLEGDAFQVAVRLIDHDAKRMHLFAEMTDADQNIAATFETVLMNVDLIRRKSSPYDAPTQSALAALKKAHAPLGRPDQLGAPLGLARKGQ